MIKHLLLVHVVLRILIVMCRLCGAQVVGTITFSKSVQYKGIRGVAAWKHDRQKHRVAEGSKLDWDGKREMHAWHVACVRRFQIPVPAGEIVSIPIPDVPMSLRVAFEKDGRAPADAANGGVGGTKRRRLKRRRTRKQPEAPSIKVAKMGRFLFLLEGARRFGTTERQEGGGKAGSR